MGDRPTKPKCSARRTNGEPCGNYPIHGGTVCRTHGGAAPQVKKKAAERIREAADDAAANLVRWMGDDALDMSLRVRVAQDLLDRAGISKLQTVSLTTPKFEALLSGERGDSPVLVDVDIEDAEVVDDDDTAARDLARYNAERARALGPGTTSDAPDVYAAPNRPTMRQRRAR